MLTGVDLHFVTKELKDWEDAKVQKIYSRGDNIYFHLYKNGEKSIIKLLYGKAIYLSEKINL